MSSVTIQIGNTQFVIPGQVPRTLSAFLRFVSTPVVGSITVRTMIDVGKKGIISIRESKPAEFYLAKEFFRHPQNCFMLTIDAEDKMNAAVFSFSLVPHDAVASVDQDESALTFEEKYLPWGLVPSFEIFVSTTDLSANVFGWAKNEKSSKEWKRYALSKLPVANAVGVGTVTNNVAAIFGAPLHHVPGNLKAGRGTCVISPTSEQSCPPWFFFAAGHCGDESIRLLNKLAGSANVRIILYDSGVGFWDLTGQKSPSPQSQLSDIRAFALFVPDTTPNTSSNVPSSLSPDTKE